VQFLDAGSRLIAAQEERINLSLNAVAIPASFYPRVTSITPVSAASIPAGTTSTITTTWTRAPALANDNQACALYDGSGARIFVFENDHLTATQTSNSITVSGLGVSPAGGSCGIGTQIGGLAIATTVSF